MFKYTLAISLVYLLSFVSFAADELGVLYNPNTNNIVSPATLRFQTIEIATNITLLSRTPSRALRLDSLTNLATSSLTDTQQEYLAVIVGGTNLIKLGDARLLSGAGNPTNGVMETNRTIYINTQSTNFNDSIWANQSTNWFRLSSTNGGSINESQLNFSNVTTANATTNAHGLLFQLPSTNSTTRFLRGDGSWSAPVNFMTPWDNLTRSVGLYNTNGLTYGTMTTPGLVYDNSEGGRLYVPSLQITSEDGIILSNNASIFNLAGPGTGTGIFVDDAQFYNLTDNIIGNVATNHHGWAPKADGNSSHFLDGTGLWSTPAGGGGGSAIGITGSPLSFQMTYWTSSNTVGGSMGALLNNNGDITTSGTITGSHITGSFDLNASTNGNFYASQYIPSFSAPVNCANGTQVNCRFVRFGNTVFVNGTIHYIKLTPSPAQFEISLPIVPAFNQNYQLSGNVNVIYEFGGLFQNTANGVAVAHTVHNTAYVLLSGDSNAGSLRTAIFTLTYTVSN